MLQSGLNVAASALSDSPAARRTLSSPDFERCYASNARPLWSYLRRMTGSAPEADDLVQKAFLRLLEKPLPPLDDAELRRYLYRMATNLAIDEFRRQRDEDFVHAEPLPVESAAILRADMQRLFEQLKPRERALLWLAHVEGYEHNDLASMLGVGSKSVKVLLFRARRKLQQLIERDWRKETRS